MLRKNLYDLCSFLCSPYTHLNIIPKISLFTHENIFNQSQSKIDFKFQWNKRNNFIINDFKFSFKYEILEQTSILIKVKLSIINSFILNPSINKNRSSMIDDYIIIAEYTPNNNIKLYNLISKEENPLLYHSLINKKLDFINTFLPLKIDNIWNIDFKTLNSMYDKIQTLSYHFSTRKVKRNSKFNIETACNYAETFALTPNPEYISYENFGGDCTNFISQILYSGGLKKTYSWTPYSNTWLRVEELYYYLINNALAYKLTDDDSLSKGTLIQFKTPRLGRFFHSGFITHRLPDGECLYCCHSYNKLNYPLSQIYPVLYPELRSLYFY